jgi:hypothetical protein
MKSVFSLAAICLLAGTTDAIKLQNKGQALAQFFDVIKRNVEALEVETDELNDEGAVEELLLTEEEAEIIAEDLGVDLEAAVVAPALSDKEQALMDAHRASLIEAGIYVDGEGYQV